MYKKRPLIALLAFMGLALLYIPAIAVAVFSVNDARYGISWRGFTLKWYRLLLDNDYILDAALNSLILATVSTILATIMGTALALGLDRAPWPKPVHKIADLVINIPVVIPDVIMAVALTMAFSVLRMISKAFDMGMATLIIGHVTFQISFVTLVVRSRLASLAPETDEAARDLFASDVFLFRRVTLPLIMPGVLAGAMLAFTLSLDDFIISFFTHGPDSMTLPIFIFASIKRGLTPEIHALSTLMLLFTVVLVIIAERLSRKI